jgi:hypothetical protein
VHLQGSISTASEGEEGKGVLSTTKAKFSATSHCSGRTRRREMAQLLASGLTVIRHSPLFSLLRKEGAKLRVEHEAKVEVKGGQDRCRRQRKALAAPSSRYREQTVTRRKQEVDSTRRKGGKR